MKNLTVREVIEALSKLPPDAPVVLRRGYATQPDHVVALQRVVALPGRDFAGHRNLDFVLETALPRGYVGGAQTTLVVLGDEPPVFVSGFTLE